MIADLVALGREPEHPMELLPHVRTTVMALAADYRLVLITALDLLHRRAEAGAVRLGDSLRRGNVSAQDRGDLSPSLRPPWHRGGPR